MKHNLSGKCGIIFVLNMHYFSEHVSEDEKLFANTRESLKCSILIFRVTFVLLQKTRPTLMRSQHNCFQVVLLCSFLGSVISDITMILEHVVVVL